MSERRYFSHGIVYVRLQGVCTYEGMLAELSRAISTGPPPLARRYASMISSHEEELKASLKAKAALSSDGSENSEDPVRGQEDVLLLCLSALKVLIVFDHVNDLLSSTVADTSTDLKMFLSRLFDRSRDIKV